MTVVRSLNLTCDREGCTAVFYGPEGIWVDGPVRAAAQREGWHHVHSRAGRGKDICPECVQESLALSVCQIPS